MKSELMLEDEVQQLVQIEAAKYKMILMRNNSGALKDKTGRLVRYGLGNISESSNAKMKSSDLIGITEVLITPDMVGKTLGVFTAIEVKKQGWKYKGDEREIAQKNFIDWVIGRGGLAAFVESVDTLVSLMKK